MTEIDWLMFKVVNVQIHVLLYVIYLNTVYIIQKNKMSFY